MPTRTGYFRFGAPGSYTWYPFDLVAGESEEETQDALIDIEKVPGGNVVYVDLGGMGIRSIPITMNFQTQAEYEAVRDNCVAAAGMTFQSTLYGAFLAALGPIKRSWRNWDGKGEAKGVVYYLGAGVTATPP